MENGITILKLPSHTSHVLQPLDVGVFWPAKVAWQKILDQFFKQSNFSTVGKAEFPNLLKQLHDSPDALKAACCCWFYEVWKTNQQLIGKK